MHQPQTNPPSRTFSAAAILLTICTLFNPALGNDLTSVSQSVYEFIPAESTFTQTGGFAGVNWTYALEGRFQLSIDPNASTAAFAAVDANAVRTDDPTQTLDPNEVFNLTGLTGMLAIDGTYIFRGHVADGSSVEVTLVLEDGYASLVAQTTPPPNSADYFIFTLDAVAQRKYGGGVGTADDPYQIWTPQQLLEIDNSSDGLDKYFRLMTNLDFADCEETSGCVVSSVFTGVFEGDNHAISNLGCPLFAQVGSPQYPPSPSVVSNLEIVEPNILWTERYDVGALARNLYGMVRLCHIEGGRVSGRTAVGGMIGRCWGGGIVGCHVNLTTIAGSSAVGGLVGDCRSQGHSWGWIISCSATGSVVGGTGVGGLVGDSQGNILNSYSSCSVSGTNVVGGLVGVNLNGGRGGGFGRIANCYSTGPVADDPNAGGLVGRNGGEVLNSFWDIETSGWTTSAGGEGKTTIEMQTAATFIEAGWDCVGETENGGDDTWLIDEGNDYPRFAPGYVSLYVYGGGSGRADDPYLIYTPEQMNMIGASPDDCSRHFKLMADIDLSQYQPAQFNIIGYGVPFFGTFDGNGHVISGFSYVSTNEHHIGLFGDVRNNGVAIKDLGLVDPLIHVEGGNCVAPLVGHCDRGTILNCYVSGGSVTGNNSVGGLVGGHGGAGAVASCYSTSNVNGQLGVGGLLGASGGQVTDSYSRGTVTGSAYIGGLVGANEGMIGGCCCSTGEISGHPEVAGLVGRTRLRGIRTDEFTSSFWDIETSGQSESYGGIGLPTAQMQDIDTFLEAGWDFVGETANGTDDIWWMPEGDYPRLWWELEGE